MHPFASPSQSGGGPARDVPERGAAGGPDDALDHAMERYARGDDAAFGTVYDLLAPRLFRYLQRLVRERQRVEDLVQGTLLQMHRARGTFVRGAAVVPWAFAIARRLVIDEFRRSRRAPPTALDDEALVTAVTSDAGPLAELEAHEVARVITRAAAEMSEPHRVAFGLLKVDGLSIAEVAELLGVTETAVKLRAHRAYEHLRAALAAAAVAR